MHVSVIFTTYNQPKWLEKVLWGFAVQRHRNFEIIVADDGSGPETRATVDQIRQETGMHINHIWHADNGFQKSLILNKAIAATQYDYLVFTDGDCIPAPDFLEWHVKLAQKSRFLSGGYVKIPLAVSQIITREDILANRITNANWLIKHGTPYSLKLLKFTPNSVIGLILDKLSTTRATWNGHNASTWKEHILAVNGFDERMQYGGQDREFGERLHNLGVRGKRIRHRAACVHLDHPRDYAKPESIAYNRAIRAETRTKEIIRTAYGIVKEKQPVPDYTHPMPTPLIPKTTYQLR